MQIDPLTNLCKEVRAFNCTCNPVSTIPGMVIGSWTRAVLKLGNLRQANVSVARQVRSIRERLEFSSNITREPG